jgi:hypothetical protein
MSEGGPEALRADAPFVAEAKIAVLREPTREFGDSNSKIQMTVEPEGLNPEFHGRLPAQSTRSIALPSRSLDRNL